MQVIKDSIFVLFFQGHLFPLYYEDRTNSNCRKNFDKEILNVKMFENGLRGSTTKLTLTTIFVLLAEGKKGLTCKKGKEVVCCDAIKFFLPIVTIGTCLPI